MFFTSCLLVSLNNYFARGKGKKGSCCNQLPVTLPWQNPAEPTKHELVSNSSEEVCGAAPPAGQRSIGGCREFGGTESNTPDLSSSTYHYVKIIKSICWLSILISTMSGASKSKRNDATHVSKFLQNWLSKRRFIPFLYGWTCYGTYCATPYPHEVQGSSPRSRKSIQKGLFSHSVLFPAFCELLFFHPPVSTRVALCPTALARAGRWPGFTWHLQETERLLLYLIACSRV